MTSTQEKIAYLSGSMGFWPGVAKMAAVGGYSAHPWPAAGGEVRFVDGPRGVVLDNGTTFPVAIARGATFDVEMEESVGRAIAIEAREGGANLFAGICCNIIRHPAWGRSQESFGEDSCHMAKMGRALTRGVQSDGTVMACVKHFALNSMENARFTVDVRCSDERTLREVYLRHFEKIVRHERPASIMSAYNKVEGHYCGENRKLLTEILKSEWGFEGFVMTDFIMGAYDGKTALISGLDLEMPFRNLIYRQVTPRMAESDPMLMSRVDDAVARLKRQVSRFSSSPVGPSGMGTVVNHPEHRALSLEVARSSIVLLRNEGEILPLRKTGGKIGVFGPLAATVNMGDRGSSMTRFHNKNPVTILEGIRKVVGGARPISYRAALDEETTPEEVLMAKARECEECVVVCGLTYKEEGEFVQPAEISILRKIVPFPRGLGDWRALARLVAESMAVGIASGFWKVITRVKSAMGRGNRGNDDDEDASAQSSAENSLPPFGLGGDRRTLGLRAEEERAIAAIASANPRTVVVLVGGSAIEMESWIERVPGVIMEFYGGIEGGTAVGETLFGDNNPGGRLPVSVPRDPGRDLPPFDREAKTALYEYEFGYRRTGSDFRFPFGYGLSYSRMTWSGVELCDDADADADVKDDEVRVGVSVRNDDETRSGDEVVQVYLSVENSKVKRVARQLVGFTKVRNVAPGETREVVVEIPLEEFEYYDENERGFTIEGGDARYLLWVLKHSGETSASERVVDVTLAVARREGRRRNG